MVDDYRNTEYCPILTEISSKKSALKKKICEEHPRIRILYNQVKNKDSCYKSQFMQIYNHKCSYCGNSIENIGTVLFEVDHYICESSFVSKEEAGKIENLVLACYDCNRSKSDYLIKDEYIETLNPDFEKIKDVFCRDELYYINISDEYKEDQFIIDFHNKLKLGYQTRRLDYLLMNIRGLCEKLDGNPKVEKLNVALRKLQKKRNVIYL
ncbi:MAG: HNH endonuclease [Sedimentibacter saalensis]|uniref:HNH endonuclease n=1 Tax=Sedimentibacter saalensis TaxID=130788 RepID=UPI002B208FC3|nr:HNH endonuclease [Sedimentibacter saalensis]MEA5094966.1 HNH endonuclease [Sedimentibacter saalensis]